MKKFPIGFWNYPSVRNLPISQVERWQNCGMTCTQTPNFSYEEHETSVLRGFLDEMHRCEMKAIVVIRELDFHKYVDNIDGYRAMFERANADFGSHPAVFGFFVGDEPTSAAEMDACKKAYKIAREINPSLTPMLNLHSYDNSIKSADLGGKSFNLWLDDFIDEIECPLISYDCYTQMNPEEEGTDRYFYNLNIYTSAAKRKTFELWTTLLSVGHFRYRPPTEDDLRWQISTAVASGCTGILWFLYYGSLTMNNYRGAPIDELGEESDTYKYLRRVQLIFHRRYGAVMATLKHRKTWHFYKSYGEYPMYSDGGIQNLMCCESEHKIPGIVSSFSDEAGNEYIVLVNNSKTESDLFSLTFKGKLCRCDRYWDYGIVDFLSYHHDALFEASSDTTTVGFYLAPGQMELLRVDF